MLRSLPLDFTAPAPSAVLAAGHYQLGLMVMAFAVACATGYNALRAAERLHERRHRERWLWRGIGAVSLGGGLWAMHFIGLLAYRAPVAIRIEAVSSLMSLLLALLTGLAAMLYVGDVRARKRSVLPAAFVIGSGLVAMQNQGLASLVTDAHKSYLLDLWLLSSLLAFATAYMALRMMLYLQVHRDHVGAEPIRLSALAIGAGGIAMHMTVMQSLRLSSLPIAAQGPQSFRPHTTLALQVALVVGVLAALILLGTYISRRGDRRIRIILDQLRRGAGMDAVTGLPLEAIASEQMNRLALRITRPAMISLFLIDCERAQRAATLLGEPGREAALRLMAQRLGSMKGSQRDILAVLDIGRFVVVTPMLSSEFASMRAGFIAELCVAPLELLGRSFRLPVRVGFSIWPQDGEDYASLLASAQLALQDAQSTQMQTSGYTPELRAISERRLEIEDALATAVDESSFELAYQPIVHAGNRRLAGIEALVRWRHPTLGQVPPDEFIAVAEEVGLTSAIDRYVLRRAVADFATLPRELRQSLRMAVNCAASTLAQPQLQAEVEAILGASGISTRRLTLEITEVAWAKGGDEILARLERIARSGIALAIDDFGTGHSSLARLQRIPASTLKIDREFVVNLGTPGGDDMVRAIVELAHRLDIKVVAEGVETEAQEQFLLAVGCHYLQGYRYGRPVPWAQLPVVAGLTEATSA